MKSQQVLAEAQNQVDDLSQTSTQLPLELETMKHHLSAEKENLFHEEEGMLEGHWLAIFVCLLPILKVSLAVLETMQKSRESKKMHLEKGHEIYERLLSMKFERQPDGDLVVKMHNIDPRDPKRLFCFSFRLNQETNLYEGTAHLGGGWRAVHGKKEGD